MILIEKSHLTMLGRELPLYILIPILGMVVAAVLNSLLAKKRGLSPSFVFRLSALGYFAFLLVQMMQDFLPKSLLLLFYPFAAIGVPAAFGLLGRIAGKEKTDMQDLGVVLVLVFALSARLGCFFSGCCFGFPWEGWCSVIYGSGTNCPMPGIALFPLQLASALVIALLLTSAVWMFIKGKRLWIISAILVGVYYIHLWVSPYNVDNRMAIGMLVLDLACVVFLIVRALRIGGHRI